MRLIGYTRVSTHEQAQNGHSLSAQRYRLEAYSVAQEATLVGVCEDAGFTGANLDRPGLQAALGVLREGKADGIVVTKLDRLTRSVKDFNQLVEKYFRTYSLASLGDSVDTTTASGRLVLNVLLSVFQWEREAISERTREGLAQAKRDGVRLGAQPADPAVVARVHQLTGKGMSLRQVAKSLTAEGHQTRRGGAWSAETVRGMLRH